MFDLDEVMKRAQAAQKRAADAIDEVFEKSEELAGKIVDPGAKTQPCPSAPEVQAQIDANTQRQVEILGQVFGAGDMEQMAANEEMLRKIMDEKVAEAVGGSVSAVAEQLFGEDMGIVAAALETLAMEDEEEEEEPGFGPELEQSLYALLDETLARVEALPEPEPVPYGKDMDDWERFGILLSGIVSNLNGHSLDGMNVEQHLPVLEQQVASVVRRSWGIEGRGELLDTLRYLMQEGYVLRYRLYGEAAEPGDLMEEGMDEEEQEAVCRAWRFAQRYKGRYGPGFLAGWDIGRAAMLARWGCYLGWLTESEAMGILWELAQHAVEELHSWREFAQSYLFGGLMWKMLCQDSAAASYLGYIANAATELLAGRAEQGGGQWRGCPWPAQRKIGFTI